MSDKSNVVKMMGALDGAIDKAREEMDPDGVLIAKASVRIDEIIKTANMPDKWIKVGGELKTVRDNLKDEKRWTKAFKSEPRELPWGMDACYKFIAIHDYFKSYNSVISSLPTSWGTLYDLTVMFKGKSAELSDCLKNGQITYDMTRKELTKLSIDLGLTKVANDQQAKPKRAAKAKPAEAKAVAVAPAETEEVRAEPTPQQLAKYAREVVPDSGLLNRALDVLMDLEMKYGSEDLGHTLLTVMKFIDTSDRTLSKSRRMSQLSEYLKQSKGEK